MVTTTEILAMIGGTTLALTAAARVPTALAEFLRACILVATAARELRAALAERAPCGHLTPAANPPVGHAAGCPARDAGCGREPPAEAAQMASAGPKGQVA